MLADPADVLEPALPRCGNAVTKLDRIKIRPSTAASELITRIVCCKVFCLARLLCEIGVATGLV